MADLTQEDLVRMTCELQNGRTALCEDLRELNRLIDSQGLQAQERSQVLSAKIFSSPKRTQLLHDAHRKTRWPAFYGQSPYESVFAVVNAAGRGSLLLRPFKVSERALYRHVLHHIGPAAARKRDLLAFDDIEARYPRLMATMREVAMLTRTEASGVILMLLRTHPSDRASSTASSEAVAHYGGNLKVVRQALLHRNRANAHRLSGLALA